MNVDRTQVSIGVTSRGYSLTRNVLYFPIEYVTVRQVKDIFRVYSYFHYRMRGTVNHFTSNLFFDAGFGRYDLNHFFNSISLVNRPWITTFETSLPRALGSGAWCDLAVRRLAHKSCFKLIAMSSCAAKIQERFLQEHYPASLDAIMSKVVVLHPAQAVLQTENACRARTYGEPLRLAFVGADFFRKGGGEVLRVFEKLLKGGLNFKLTIVSTMKYGDYASKTTNDDLVEAMRVINDYPDQISWHKTLPNTEVLALFKEADVALLPTWGDTYGYSVLEAQACGCPVITTDIRALPEINDETCGWMINVPKDNAGNGRVSSSDERKIFSSKIEDQLNSILSSIIETPSALVDKGRNSIRRIEEKHSPRAHARRLESYYQKAVQPG